MDRAQDRARQRTDKQLRAIERKMGRVYETDPALIAVMRKYKQYMAFVDNSTRGDYEAYINETDVKKKAELKKIYSNAVLKLTLQSKRYKALVDEFTTVLSQANQQALAIANGYMLGIYAENYNEVATDCRKAGIDVDGEEER